MDIIPKNFKPYLWMPNQADINNCLDQLQSHYLSIKNLYLYLSTNRGKITSADEKTQYPFISEARIKDFCFEIGILEKLEKKVEEDPVKKLKIKKGKTAKQKTVEGLSVKVSVPQLNKADSVLDNTPLEASKLHSHSSEISLNQAQQKGLPKHHAYLSSDQIDHIFQQANQEYEDDDANPDDLMNRVELMEFLMRLAQVQRANVMSN